MLDALLQVAAFVAAEAVAAVPALETIELAEPIAQVAGLLARDGAALDADLDAALELVDARVDAAVAVAIAIGIALAVLGLRRRGQSDGAKRGGYRDELFHVGAPYMACRLEH